MLGRCFLKRAHAGLPAILLGTLFNVLDAVSTGLLVFPSDGAAFSGLQNKSMSIYIMSSLLSQVAMTLGGSLFPGGLGAMLIEVLPFMRGVASDIRNALGDDSPSVVPTVMVAYALSSFLIGIIFIIIGGLGLGRLVSYFPQTVLTGAIGGIGVSLFILGLELPLPSDQTLTLSNAGRILFSHSHIGVLLASALPIFFLCFSVRSTTLSRWSHGAVENPYYVPCYILMIGAMFWIVVGGIGLSKLGGLSTLADQGWLFSTSNGASTAETPSLSASLNYWSLFDFHLVELSALRHAIVNFVLLVVIGVLNLPLYVPALALALDVPYSMDHELIGQGAANILAGACGSVPNILQLSYSVFFTRAGGKRIEAGIVIVLTAVLYVVSSKLIRYIPTILASGLVLFLGIELTLEAVWESAKYFVWSEWLVVMATLFACTFVGFAQGVGVGICAAFVVYTGWGCFDLRARKMDLVEYHSLPNSARHYKMLRYGPEARTSDLRSHSLRFFSSNSSSEEAGLNEDSKESSEIDLRQDDDMHNMIKIVRLDGYIFFGVVPTIEKAIASSKALDGATQSYIIMDMRAAHRVETAAARLIKTKARDTPGTTVLLCGFGKNSGTAADLNRSGIELCFTPDISNCYSSGAQILAFEDSDDAVAWCKTDIAERRAQTSDGLFTGLDFTGSMRNASRKFVEVFGYTGSKSTAPLLDFFSPVGLTSKVKVSELKSAVMPRPTPSPKTIHMICVVSGAAHFLDVKDRNFQGVTKAPKQPSPVRYNRESLLDMLVGTSRYMASLAMHWHRSRAVKDQSIPSPSSTSISSDLKGEWVTGDNFEQGSRVKAGDVIYVQAQQISPTTDEYLVHETFTSEEQPSKSMVKEWPDKSPILLVDPGPDPCYIVEILLSGDLPASSNNIICREAIRGLLSKSGL